jgi:integrase
MDLAAAIAQHIDIAPSRRSGLVKFQAYAQVDDTSALRAQDTVDFLRTLIAQDKSTATILDYRSAVNNFFRWLFQQGQVSFDARSLRQAFVDQAAIVPKRSRPRIEAPAEGEVESLVEAAYAARPASPAGTPAGRSEHLAYLRNIAIVEMLQATGVRGGELVRLRRCDLDEARQVACAPDGRLLYFDLESWGALARYLAARGDPEGYPLFVWQAPVFARHDRSSQGPGLLPMHRPSVGRILQKLRRSEGLTARTLRRRFGRRLMAASADERGTAALMGIKYVANVRRYAT